MTPGTFKNPGGVFIVNSTAMFILFCKTAGQSCAISVQIPQTFWRRLKGIWMICDGFNVSQCDLKVCITNNYQNMDFVSCQLLYMDHLIIGIVVVIMNHHQWGHISNWGSSTGVKFHKGQIQQDFVTHGQISRCHDWDIPVYSKHYLSGKLIMSEFGND